jgi:hypothetical protein
MLRRPLMIVMTLSALPSLFSSRSAYTFPAFQLPANTVPPGLCARDRTWLRPSAHTEIWNPGGNLIFVSCTFDCAGATTPAATTTAAIIIFFSTIPSW